MTLPNQTQAKEFIFIARYGISTGLQQLSFSFPVPNLTSIGLAFTQGYQLDNGNGFCQINVNCDSHKANIIALRINGVDYASTSMLYCYYR